VSGEDESNDDEEGCTMEDMLDPEFPVDFQLYLKNLKNMAQVKDEEEGERGMDDENWEEEQLRTFGLDQKELLPLKIDGKIIRQLQPIEAEESDGNDEERKPDLDDLKMEITMDEEAEDKRNSKKRRKYKGFFRLSKTKFYFVIYYIYR
jgi:hypothetical protein